MSEVNTQFIPAELKAIDRWVVWKHTGDRKKPYQVNGEPASHTTPEHWTTFESAWQHYATGQADGVGFVLTKDDPYVFVDFDKIKGDDGKFLPFYDFAVHAFGSYAEVSQSGDGIHIICKGRKPGTKCHQKPHFEMYEHGRLVYLTGKVYAGYTDIKPAQRQIDALYNHFITSASRDVIQGKLSRLWSGDSTLWNGDQSSYPSQSEADQALINLIEWYSDRTEPIDTRAAFLDRVFCKSGLYRDKWNDRMDYRERTIENALQATLKPGLSTPSSDGGAGEIDQHQLTVNSGTLEGALQAIGDKVAGQYLYKAILPHVVNLDKDDYKAATKTIKDALGSRVNLNTLLGRVKGYQRDVRTQRQLAEVEEQGKPIIHLSNRDGAEVVDEMAEAIRAWNTPARIFTRSGDTVHIVQDEDDRPAIALASFEVLDDRISRAASFVSEAKMGIVQGDAPARYVRRLSNLENSPFPALKGIVESPIIRHDGSILDQPGYDAETRLYYQPVDGFTMPPIPEKPTEKQLQAAVGEFRKLVKDFNLVDDASFANYLGLMLTTIARPLFGGCTPAAGIDGPIRGSGKSLLTSLVSLTATGRAAETMSQQETNDEWRKQITSQLMKGSPIVIIDNVKGRLESSALEQALTSETWSDRQLGTNKQVTLPQHATWIATGNNLTPYGDMTRRMYMIRINPESSNPQLRKPEAFTYPDIKGHVLENRSRYLGYLLMMARAWCVAGKKKGKGHLGGFESWASTISGILEHAGVEGFLGNVVTTQSTGDEQAEELFEVLHSLYALYGDKEISTKKLAGELIQVRAQFGVGGEFLTTSPNDEQAMLLDIINALPGHIVKSIRDGEAGSVSRRIGKYLGYALDRRVVGPEKEEENANLVTYWATKSREIKRATLWVIEKG